MKKIFYLLLLFYGITNAQIVNIPDANFKNKLLQANTTTTIIARDINSNAMVIDANGDGEIQVSEALNVYQLQVVNSSIQDLTGIEAFVNLTVLHCFSNNLSVLDFSNNVNLSLLRCESNALTELNISGLVNLTDLRCYINNLTELDLSDNVNLTDLLCFNNNLTTLDISNNSNLTLLDCNNNALTELDVSGNSNLIHLYCENNALTELDVSNNVGLIFFGCGYNDLTELDVSNNVSLTQLVCSYNSLTELDVSNNINLTHLIFESNNLTELDLQNNTNLTHLLCENNNLTELDLSNNAALETLNIANNPQLAYLNIKNGGILEPNNLNSEYYWGNLPDNIYICADEEEAITILPYLNQNETTGQTIATYCDIPGANYNTITGIVMYDFYNDGCDENDITHYTKIVISDGTEQGYSFTNTDGNYLFFTQEGTFTLAPEVENPNFFNITPITETVVFTDNNNNEEIVNFCITPNGVHNDLEVVIAPINPARPGFEATYKIVYRNKGNQVMSQDYGLNFMYNQNLMTFVGASVAPDTQGPGGMNWTYENLLPFESREITVTMQINPPTDPENPVNIDDVLTFTSVIMPQAGDENVTDNTYVFNQTVVGAYDPNDITCLEGDIVDPEYIGEELHYVIRFENTGNYYAENVVIAMEINEELYDVSSLRVLDASHDVRAQVRDNVAEFFFNQIMLDSGGHGNILLVMKSHTALEEGDAVLSKADIYFDYNYPIITNDAVTVFETTMSIDENIKNVDLKVYPNPTTDYFNLMSEAKIQSVELYDISGRLIKTSLINNFETKQDITTLNKGTYILKIKTENGEITGKIIKK